MRSAASSTVKPPEQLVFFLDESLDSATIAGALQEAGIEIVRATQRFPRGTLDKIWLTEAGSNKWVVLTRDKRIRYRQLELLELLNASVRAFVFTGGNVSVKETAGILVGAQRHLERISRANSGPFIYHLGRSGKPVRMK